MTCFLSCGLGDEESEMRKRSCMLTVRQIVNRFRRDKTCLFSCSAEEKKEEKKRFCFVKMIITMRNRYKNRNGGVNENI